MTEIESLKKALDFIETHLLEPFTLDDVASAAGYSLYHFHRLFRSIFKDSLKEYIRKRRMTEAAKELVESERAIIDLALKYQYESRESFSRSFKRIYGKNPSEVRQKQLLYTIREALTDSELWNRYQQVEVGLEPHFRTLPERIVFGESIQILADGSNFKEIPLFWSRWQRAYPSFVNVPLLGICRPAQGQLVDYLIGTEALSYTEEMPFLEKWTIPAGLYATFHVSSPLIENIQKTWDDIYGVWLPKTTYRCVGNLDIENYCHDATNAYVELMIAVEHAT